MAQAFALTEFTTGPIRCESELQYSCTNVVGPGSVDFTTALCGDGPDIRSGALTLTADYPDRLSTLPIGVYTFTITATT
jgi:hypothetical protein